MPSIDADETRLNGAGVERQKRVIDWGELLTKDSSTFAVNEWLELLVELQLLLQRNQLVSIESIGCQTTFNWLPVGRQSLSSEGRFKWSLGPDVNVSELCSLPKGLFKLSLRLDTNNAWSNEFHHMEIFCNVVLKWCSSEQYSTFRFDRTKQLEPFVGRVF